MAGIMTCISLHLDAEGEGKISAFLEYDPKVPFHVHVNVPNFTAFDIPRDAVAAGLNRSCPPNECSCSNICLQDAGSGWLQAILQLPRTERLHAWILRQDLEEFLVRAFSLVPDGRELLDYDWDAALRKLHDPDS
ncbi:hypothetical protein [Streptosporangium sp. NPDC002524]|uniref:hypothetical protein n=1 Tax=Streptosporangium sp. NPDC002524 TaxID=3154537 RepID=UPI00331E253F